MFPNEGERESSPHPFHPRQLVTRQGPQSCWYFPVASVRVAPWGPGSVLLRKLFFCLKGPMLAQDLGVAEGIGAFQLRMSPKPLRAMLLRDVHSCIHTDTNPQRLSVFCGAQSSSDFHCLLWSWMGGSWEGRQRVGKELVNSQASPPWYPLGSSASADSLQSYCPWGVAQTGLHMMLPGHVQCCQSCLEYKWAGMLLLVCAITMV